VVRRIRLVTQPYRHVEGRSWEPVSATAEYQDLTSSPAGFDADLDAEGPLRRVQTGLLVDLEVVAAD
jgi:hypothetical protein